MTRNGIEINLSITPYRSVILYDNDQKIEYRFSSEFYKKKFDLEYGGNRYKINNSLSNRFNIPIENTILCDVVLYKKIEQRGFLIILDGEELWQDQIKLIGDRLTRKS